MQKTLNLLIVLLLGFNTLFAQNFVNQNNKPNQTMKAENNSSFTSDGAWCWFSDPRAIYYEGKYKRTYAGWVDSKGSILVAYYDHDTKNIQTYKLYDKLEVDDHDNPALSIDKAGHLSVFFSQHAKPFPIQLHITKNPEDISAWNEPITLKLNDTVAYKRFSDTYTYQNPVYLADEDKYYLFWRGADWKPNYSVSSDGGKTWSKGKIFVLPERIYKDRRPYMKVTSNGKDQIYFAFTDGHPRNEKTNSIYYMSYKQGAFHKADGTVIKDIGAEPVQPRETSIVYDATLANNPKAWIWDIAQDKHNNPVLVYAKFPDNNNHIYCYSKWDGKKWLTQELVNSGGYFPKTMPGKTEPEPNYSGGIALDHENPDVVYLSVKRNNVFEIEKWTAKSKGKSWDVEAITKDSSKDNIRPFAVRNAGKNNPLQVLWMENAHYQHFTDYVSAIKMNVKK